MTDPRDPPEANRELGGTMSGTDLAGRSLRPANLPVLTRAIGVLAVGVPTLTVAFAVVMAGFLLAESIADAVAVRVLRAAGIIVLLLLVADGLLLASILGLRLKSQTQPAEGDGATPLNAPDTSDSPAEVPLPPRAQNRD